ncbi:hypothetical protein [Streptacidiphilus cavernicola]|uniref:SCP domain-containing protein n=1 Tax=Streptacidiphilus cavernicola TaxID=3342716 RepID=A0ABV6VY64_9ACTN
MGAHQFTTTATGPTVAAAWKAARHADWNEGGYNADTKGDAYQLAAERPMPLALAQAEATRLMEDPRGQYSDLGPAGAIQIDTGTPAAESSRRRSGNRTWLFFGWVND